MHKSAYSQTETVKIIASFIKWLEALPKEMRIEVVRIMYADYVQEELPDENVNLN